MRRPAASSRAIHGAASSRRADRIEHRQHRAGRAAVPWTLERPDGGDHRGHRVGVRRRHHARGEGRCVHAVVRCRHQIGIERAGALHAGARGAGHAQIVCGMAEARIGREHCHAFAPAPPRGGKHRDRGGELDFQLSGRDVIGAQVSQRRAQCVHRVGRIERIAQRRQAREGAHPRAAERRAQRGVRVVVGQRAVPQQPAHRLEVVMQRQFFHVVAADHQAAALAVDVAQLGVGDHHAFQSVRIHRQLLVAWLHHDWQIKVDQC